MCDTSAHHTRVSKVTVHDGPQTGGRKATRGPPRGTRQSPEPAFSFTLEAQRPRTHTGRATPPSSYLPQGNARKGGNNPAEDLREQGTTETPSVLSVLLGNVTLCLNFRKRDEKKNPTFYQGPI